MMSHMCPSRARRSDGSSESELGRLDTGMGVMGCGSDGGAQEKDEKKRAAHLIGEGKKDRERQKRKARCEQI